MKKKRLLTIEDLDGHSLKQIIKLAFDVKKKPKKYMNALKGKNLGLIFEKPSTRTRVSFEVGINQLGGSSFYLSPGEIQPGKREAVKDIARTLARYLDCIVLRTFTHELIEKFDKYSSVPVINGLSDRAHPCQALADYLTICEKYKNVRNITVAYIGDANNVLYSLMLLFAKTGVNLTVGAPSQYSPDAAIVAHAQTLYQQSGGKLKITNSPEEAVSGADVVYTDVWISMGENQLEKDEEAFKPFQLNRFLLDKANKKAIVMHCLPAHRGQEITDDVIESEQSVVFDQAENRMHAQKAVMLHFLK